MMVLFPPAQKQTNINIRRGNKTPVGEQLPPARSSQTGLCCCGKAMRRTIKTTACYLRTYPQSARCTWVKRGPCDTAYAVKLWLRFTCSPRRTRGGSVRPWNKGCHERGDPIRCVLVGAVLRREGSYRRQLVSGGCQRLRARGSCS